MIKEIEKSEKEKRVLVEVLENKEKVWSGNIEGWIKERYKNAGYNEEEYIEARLSGEVYKMILHRIRMVVSGMAMNGNLNAARLFLELFDEKYRAKDIRAVINIYQEMSEEEIREKARRLIEVEVVKKDGT